MLKGGGGGDIGGAAATQGGCFRRGWLFGVVAAASYAKTGYQTNKSLIWHADFLRRKINNVHLGAFFGFLEQPAVTEQALLGSFQIWS